MSNDTGLSLNPFSRGGNVRTRWIPEIPEHLQAKFEREAKELRVVEHARSEGALNQPMTDDTAPDDTQRKIWTRMKEGANLLRQFAADQLVRAEEKARNLIPAPLRAEAAEAEVKAALAENRHAHRDQLISLRLDERKRQRDLRKFRRDNELSRNEAYSDDPWKPALWLLCAILIDALMNGLLFQKVSTFGLLGGVALAGLVSAITIASGYATGFFGLRLLRHVKPALCTLGGLFTATGAVVGISWIALVARFRDLIELHPDLDTTELLKSASALEWMSFSSLEAWALLLIGLLIWAFAVVKGSGGHSSFADPYWGHSAQHRGWQQVHHAFDEAKQLFRADVQATIDAARAAFRDRFAAEHAAAADAQALADHAERRADEVRDSIDEWVAAAVGLIKLYQQENCAIRMTPPPAYFEQVPVGADVIPDLPNASAVRALADEAKLRAAENESAWAGFQERLTALGQQELDDFLGWIGEIESIADKRLRDDWKTKEDETDAVDRRPTAPGLPSINGSRS